MPLCPLCDSRNQRPYLKVNAYQIVQCQRCRFLFVSPPPSQEELAAFYQQPGYYTGSTLGYQDYFGQREAHEKLARNRLRRIERLCPLRGRILDVGCAAGFFLHVAQTRGWDVSGVELSEDMAAYAARLTGGPIVPGVSALDDEQTGSFDAITCWEYIEHIPDPRDDLRRLVRFLRPGGVLALSTPNTCYWEAVHQPERWREFKPPAHLGFFTAATLRLVLTASGLDLVALPHVGARAPAHPYAAHRMLELLRERVGNGADRRTPLWWTFSLAWRLVERSAQAAYALRWPDSDIQAGIEAYTRKL